ncbi:V-type immunoglobulin domain-containing suppressor of T-cell activation [Brienomyrus brachyistius]|uniref:V-type immunoglobulin domain-containing suppressor of T-cell activation n=1 Tax=Brienomyrus brachyistius TaxID=42636 RepID=UPI0020B18F58|nr:V-type immunoglobulin domain-containing suppressor of T-cell activation [Brienomyrus brachyistius]
MLQSKITMLDLYWKSSSGIRFGFCWICIYLTATSFPGPASSDHLRLSAAHRSYICPEGANVTMQCISEGSLLHTSDQLKPLWFFTPHLDGNCRDRMHPRNGNHSSMRPPGYSTSGNTLSITLTHVTRDDQGLYCCVELEVQHEHQHLKVPQRARSHVLLSVGPRQNESAKCSFMDHKPIEGTVAAGLATAGCIMGILSLPLILLLVYKQRQTAHSSRRSHELVRMDSEARGHENPVFLGDGPQPKTRTVSQILTRQSSETGRHLLSDPGTPLSPPTHGDVFFPAHEPIPESPDFMQV